MPEVMKGPCDVETCHGPAEMDFNTLKAVGRLLCPAHYEAWGCQCPDCGAFLAGKNFGTHLVDKLVDKPLEDEDEEDEDDEEEVTMSNVFSCPHCESDTTSQAVRVTATRSRSYDDDGDIVRDTVDEYEDDDAEDLGIERCSNCGEVFKEEEWRRKEKD